MGPLGGMPTNTSNQEREADKRLHESKMELLNALEKEGKKSVSKSELEVKALRGMNVKQKMYLLEKLEKEYSMWGGYGAVQEQAWVEKAISAFKRKDYSCGLIYRYIKSKDINEALELK